MSGISDFLPLAANQSSIDVAQNAPNIPQPTLSAQTNEGINDDSFSNYIQAPSLETQMAPTPFDWNKSQADRFTQSSHFGTEGFNPYATPEVIDGKSYDANELKYAGVQTWGDVMSNAVGGGWGLAKNTFVEGWKGWADLGNAVFNWGSDETFMQRLAGSPEELLVKDEEQKAIFNKYAIFKSPVHESNFGVFNREFIGDMIQQSGFSIGAGAQFLSEMLLTWGIGEGMGAVAKGAGWLARGIEGAEDVKNIITTAEKSKQITSTGEKINAMRKMTDPTSVKSFSQNMWDYAKQASAWTGEQFDVIGGINKMAKAKDAGASTYQLVSMGVGNITRFAAALNSATTEARFEAANTYGQMYGTLIDEWQQKHDGQMPTGHEIERIRKMSYAAATDNFGGNTALLMAFNQIEFGNIMSKFGSSSRLMRQAIEQGEGEIFTVAGKLRRDIPEIAGGAGLKEGQKATQAYLKGTFGALSNFNTIRKDFGLGTALWQVGKRSGKLEVMEGLQEILQTAGDKTFTDYYTNLYHGGKDIEGSNFVKAIEASGWKSLQSQLSMEGWQTFLMGAATGLFISPMQAGVMGGFKKAQAGINQQYKGEVNAHKKMMQDATDTLNTWYNDPKKSLSEHIAGLKVQGKADQNMMQALVNGDRYEFQNAKDDAFANAVSVAIKTGNYESFVDSIKELGDRLTDEQFEEAFGLKSTPENKTNARAFTQSIVRNIEDYYENHERLMDEFGHLVQPELYAHDAKEYNRAKMAKKSLDESINIMATTSFHATNTIKRATEIRAEAASLHTVGSSANKTFEILGNIANAENELGRLREELANYKGIESDPTVAKKIANAEQQIKHLTDWVNAYEIFNQYKKTGDEEALRKTTPFVGGDTGMYRAMQKMIDAHTGYMTAINNEYGIVTGVPDRREMTKAFNLLMDYDKLNKDHARYVNALNVISDPRGFNLLYQNVLNGMYAANAQLRTDHIKEIKNRISAVTGVPVDEILTTEEERERERTGNLREQKTLRTLLDKTEKEITDLLEHLTENEKETTASNESIVKIQEEIAKHKETIAAAGKSKSDAKKQAQKLVKSLNAELKIIKKAVKALEKEKVGIAKTFKRLEYLKTSYGKAISELEESTGAFEDIHVPGENLRQKGLLGRLNREKLSVPGEQLDQLIEDAQKQLDDIDNKTKYYYNIIAATEKLIAELNLFVDKFTEGTGIPEELQANYEQELTRLQKKISDTKLNIDNLIEAREKVSKALYQLDLSKQQQENIANLKVYLTYVKTIVTTLEEAGLEEEYQEPEAEGMSPEEEEAAGPSEDEEKLKSEIIAFYAGAPKPPAPAAPPTGGAAPVVSTSSTSINIGGKDVDLQKMVDTLLAKGNLDGKGENPLDLEGTLEEMLNDIEGYAEEEGIKLNMKGSGAAATTAPVPSTTSAPVVEAVTELSPEAEAYLAARPELKKDLENTKAEVDDKTKTSEQAEKEIEAAIIEAEKKATVSPILDQMLSYPDLPGNPHVEKVTESEFRVPIIDYSPYPTAEKANAALREWVNKKYPTAKEMTPAERKIFVARKKELTEFDNKVEFLKDFFSNVDLDDVTGWYIATTINGDEINGRPSRKEGTVDYQHFVRSLFIRADNFIKQNDPSNPLDNKYYDSDSSGQLFLKNWETLLSEQEYKNALKAYVIARNKVDEKYDKQLVDLNKSMTPEEKRIELIRLENKRLKDNIKYFPKKLYYNPITEKEGETTDGTYVVMRSINHSKYPSRESAEAAIDEYSNKKIAGIQQASLVETAIPETETETGTGSITGTPVSDIDAKTKEELFPIDSLFQGTDSKEIMKVIGYTNKGAVRLEVQSDRPSKITKNFILSELKRLIKEGKLVSLSEAKKPISDIDAQRAEIKGQLSGQGTQVEIEVKGYSGKEFLITIDRSSKVSIWSEKQPDGTYRSGEGMPEESKNKLYKKYVPESVQNAITEWSNAFKGSWAAEETQDGKNYTAAEEKLNQELAALGKEEVDTTEEPEIVTGTEKEEVIEITPEVLAKLRSIGIELSDEEKAVLPYLMGKVLNKDTNTEAITSLARKISTFLSSKLEGFENEDLTYNYTYKGKEQGSEEQVASNFLNGIYDDALAGKEPEEEKEEVEEVPVTPVPTVYFSTSLKLLTVTDFDAAWADDSLWNDGGKTPQQRQQENTYIDPSTKKSLRRLPSNIKNVYDEKAKRERTKLFASLSKEDMYDRISIEYTSTPGKPYPANLYIFVDGIKVGYIDTREKNDATIALLEKLETKLKNAKGKGNTITITGTAIEQLISISVGPGSLDIVKPLAGGGYEKGIPFEEVMYNSNGTENNPIILRNTETGSSRQFGEEEDIPQDKKEDKSIYKGAYSALIKFPNGHSYWIQLSHRTLNPAEVQKVVSDINEQAIKASLSNGTDSTIDAINKELNRIFPTINVFNENADKRGLKVYLRLNKGSEAEGIPGGKKLDIVVSYEGDATQEKVTEYAEIKQQGGKTVNFTDPVDFMNRINEAISEINKRKTMPSVPAFSESNMKEQIPLEGDNVLPAIMRMNTNVKSPQVVSNVAIGINVVMNDFNINDQANDVPKPVKQNKTASGGGSVVEKDTPTQQEEVNPNAEPVKTSILDMPRNTPEDYAKWIKAIEEQNKEQAEAEARANEKKANKILKGSPVFTAKSIENIESFITWVKDRLPQGIISVEDMQTIVNNLQENTITVGEFIAYLGKLNQIKGVIRTSKESPFKYHEAFHAVFRLLLDQKQIDSLLAEARKEFGITEEGLEELRTLSPENMKLTRKQLEELYLEEKMADKFDEYMMGKKAPVSSGIKGLFEKLLRFIKNFFSRFTPSDLKTFFREIDEGKYKNSTIQSNSFTDDIRTNPLGFTIPACKIIKTGTDTVVLPNGKTVLVDRHLPQKDADRIVSTITALFDIEVKSKKLKEYNSEAILDGILNRYKDTYNPLLPRYFEIQSKIANPSEALAYSNSILDVQKIFSQKETRALIKDAVASSLRVLGYEVTLDSLENDKLTDTYGPRSSDKFDKKDPGAAAGPEGKAQELRRFIGATVTDAVDQFGNTHYQDGTRMKEAVNAGDVYNGMLKLLANTSNIEDQIKKLLAYREMNMSVNEETGEEKIISNKHTVAVINRLLEFTGYNFETNEFTQNQEMVNLFLKGFSSYAANYLFTQVDSVTGSAITTFANNKDSSTTQVQNWANAFSFLYEPLLLQESNKEGKKSLYKRSNAAIETFKEAVNETSKKKKQNKTVINNTANKISAGLKEKFGIDLHPNYIKYSILAAKNEEFLNKEQKEFVAIFGSVEPITEKILTEGLTNTLFNGISPFQKASISELGTAEQIEENEENFLSKTADNSAYNILLKLADNNSIFDETIGSMSFITADNELRYSHTHPNFYHINISDLNKPEVIEQMRRDVEKNTSSLLSNSEFDHLAKNKKITVNMVEGLKDLSSTKDKGSVYGDFIKRDNLVYLLSMYDVRKRKDAKVVKSSNFNDHFFKVGHLIRTVEAKKAGYVVDLPVIHAATTKDGKTGLSDTALDILYKRVLAEIDKIQRVNNELQTGLDADGNPLKLIEGYHTGNKDKVDELRGLKLYETRKMLGDLALDIEAGAIDPTYKLDEKEIKNQLNDYWMQEVDRFVEMMKNENLINAKNKRLLAPQYLFTGFSGKGFETMNDKMYLIKDNFIHNIAQVFMNDYLNTSAVNQLLHGDESKSFKLFIEQVKRAAGANASGPSIESIVTKAEWGINHKLETIHHVTFEDTKFRQRDGNKGNQDDGQMYCTEKGMRYMLFGMGTLKQVQVDLLNKIKEGKTVTVEEFHKAGGIQDMKAAMNPMKLVYFDGATYLKCAVQLLAKEDTSYWNKAKGKWVARPGQEERHLLREKMEAFENGWKKGNHTDKGEFIDANERATIVFAHPKEVSKGIKKNIAKANDQSTSIQNITADHFNSLPAKYMRQQLENPSGKKEMTDPTQKLQQIFAEIPPTSRVYFNGKWQTGKDAVDHYLELISDRVKNNYKMKRNAIFDLGDAFDEIGAAYAKGEITPKLTDFYNSCYDNLLATGADSQTLEFFRTKDNEIQYDLNFPATLQKYTQLFLAYFSNGALSAKVPGLTLTLVSNANHKLIKRLISVDENGQPKEWEVITRAMFDADPEKYDNNNLIRYAGKTKEEKLKRLFDDLEEKLASGKPVYYLDDLRDNVGIYDKNGERIGNYSEYLTTQHFEQSEDSALVNGFAVRIPSDDKHSYMNCRRVDLLPIWMGSTGMFPQEMMEKSGTDFDLDKVFLSIMDSYAQGNKRIAYGTATTDQEKFEEYVTWQYNNNKVFKAKVNASIKADTSLAEILKEKAELNESQSQLISKLLQSDRDIEKEKETKHLLLTASGYVSAKGIYLKDLKDAKQAIVEKYNEGKKTADELQEYIKETKDWHMLQVLAEMKMPNTVEKFKKAGGEKINIGVINNKVLQSNEALLGSEAITGGENPILNVSTSTEMFNDFARMLESTIKDPKTAYAKDLLAKLKDAKEDTNSMIGKEISRDTNAQGRDNIGAAANAVINYSINSTFDIKVKGKKIFIDGKEYDSYGNLKAWNGKGFDGERVFAALSAIENAMTDNAKYAYSGKYGLNIGAVGYIANMVSQGIPFETAMLFIIQPTVQEYFKRISNLKSNIKTEEEQILFKSQIMDTLEEEISKMAAEKEEEEKQKEEAAVKAGEKIKTKKKSKKGEAVLRQTMIENIDNNKMSIDIFNILKIIDAQTTDLMDLSKILKLTQGLPTTWEEFDDIKASMDKFGLIHANTKKEDLTIDVEEMMTDQHKFMAEYIKIFKDIDSISRTVFIERTDEFKRISNIISNNFTPDFANRDNFNKTLKHDLISFMSIKAYMVYLKNEGLGSYLTSLNHAMIYPEAYEAITDFEDAIDIVQRLRVKFNKETVPNYFVNYFLNCFPATTKSGNFDTSKINKIEANSWAKLSPYQQEKVIDSFISLYSNKETHLDAVALYHYLLVKDGGQFKSGSFIRYVHNGIFKNLLNQSGAVNKLLSSPEINEDEYKKLFELSSTEMIDAVLKSYATYEGNRSNIKNTNIARPKIKDKNSPIYEDSEKGVIYVDCSAGPKSEFGNNLQFLAINGFANEDTPYIDEKTKKRKTFVQLRFPYSIIINNQLYILKNIDKGVDGVEQEPSSLIQKGEFMAKGKRAIYVKGKFRGSSDQFGGAGVFGKMPIRGEFVQVQDKNIVNPPYSPDVPNGKDVTIKTEAGTILTPSDNNQTLAVVKIVADPWAAQTRGEGISVIRGKAGSTSNYGNPFTGTDKGEATIKLGSVAEAVQAYKDWLAGTKWQEVEPERRQWINNQINSGKLDGKTLLYYKNIGEESHADALASIVNKRNNLTPADLNEKQAIDELQNKYGLLVYRIGQNGKYGIKKIATGETFEREGITPQEMLKTLNAPKKVEGPTELEIMEMKLAQLEDAKEILMQSHPEIAIALNMPKINSKSAQRETGGKTGVNKDINSNLVRKDTDMSVEKAAEDILADTFYERSGLGQNMDQQDIRNVIIEILKVGRNNFINSIINQDEIDQLKRDIKELKLANKQSPTQATQAPVSETNVSLPSEQMTDKQWEQELSDIYASKERAESRREWVIDKLTYRDGRREVGVSDATILQEIKKC
jgi:hypothetical protein